MIRAILFDLDGVLVEACDWHYEAFNQALMSVANYSIPYDEHLSTYNGLSTKIKLDMLIAKKIITTRQLDDIWKAKQIFTKEIVEKKATPDLEKIQLHEMTASLNIISACVTNSIRETTKLMLDKTWQLGYMKTLVCNEDTERNKPFPDPYIFAMKKLGLNTDEVLIIEDSEIGMISALASKAHVKCVKNCSQVNIKNMKDWLSEIGD